MVAPRIVWWVWLTFAVVNLVDLVWQGSGHFVAVVVTLLVMITGVVYACALRPRVVADQAGIRVLNPVRDHRVPWGTVRAVDVGDWVRVHCAPGPDGVGEAGKTIDSWALFAPARARLKAERHARDPAVRSAAARLPEEARNLASLSAAQAIALRLDQRADRERKSGAAGGPPLTTWAWPSLAAMLIPAVALIIVVVA
jgi:hypothetical protein